MAAFAISLMTGVTSAEAQCNPTNRLSEVHVPHDPPPRERIDAIMARFRAEPQLYDLLGCPVDYFGTSKDGGAFINFDRGAAYAPPGRRVVEIHGAIREKWAEYRWEHGLLGYPISDELSWNGGDGRYSKFEGGVIIWSPANGAHAVYGAIWDALRRRTDSLGPTSEEYASIGGGTNCPKYHRQQNFVDLRSFGLTAWVACWDANTGRVTWKSHLVDIGLPSGGPPPGSF